MGTEVAISFSTLRAQLESEKSSLFKIDENIKRIQVSGRFPTDRLVVPLRANVICYSARLPAVIKCYSV